MFASLHWGGDDLYLFTVFILLFKHVTFQGYCSWKRDFCKKKLQIDTPIAKRKTSNYELILLTPTKTTWTLWCIFVCKVCFPMVWFFISLFLFRIIVILCLTLECIKRSPWKLSTLYFVFAERERTISTP